jgi:hypothetical protein
LTIWFYHVVSEPINPCNRVKNHQQHPWVIGAVAAAAVIAGGFRFRS